jgi:predicted ATP-dependent Lon-type protease
MPTKQLDRLMFVQGGQCFFCKQPLSKAEASVEHLYAKANGGDNSDENCVACCKAVNALLGSMSLKEKIQVALNQKGQFKCPNHAGSKKPSSKASSASKQKEDKYNLVVANLKQRGNSRPRTLKTLSSTITSLFPKGLSEEELLSLLDQLQTAGKVSVTDNKVTYSI